MIILLFALDYRFYHFFAWIIYGFSILLLIAVLVVGVRVNNSQSWIRIMGFNLQPSEFVKIATSLAIARYLSGYNIKLWTWKSMVVMGVIIGLPIGLIASSPIGERRWYSVALSCSCIVKVCRVGSWR